MKSLHIKSSIKKPNFKIDEITLLLIVAVIALVISFNDKSNGISNTEAEKITGLIMDEHDFSFANSGIIDESKMNEIRSLDYGDFKRTLKTRKDFCIYIEDEKGNILLAKGSSKLNGDGIVCRE